MRWELLFMQKRCKHTWFPWQREPLTLKKGDAANLGFDPSAVPERFLWQPLLVITDGSRQQTTGSLRWYWDNRSLSAASVLLPPFLEWLHLVRFSWRWVRRRQSGTMKIISLPPFFTHYVDFLSQTIRVCFKLHSRRKPKLTLLLPIQIIHFREAALTHDESFPLFVEYSGCRSWLRTEPNVWNEVSEPTRSPLVSAAVWCNGGAESARLRACLTARFRGFTVWTVRSWQVCLIPVWMSWLWNISSLCRCCTTTSAWYRKTHTHTKNEGLDEVWGSTMITLCIGGRWNDRQATRKRSVWLHNVSSSYSAPCWDFQTREWMKVVQM